MEDKRITRTKTALKQTLFQLLEHTSFEDISIKELCHTAGVSRVTFYTHYNDKFDLVDDIFNDMENLGRREFLRLQSSNNPTSDPITGYCNLLDCILTVYFDHSEFFRHTDPSKNPYLAVSFYTRVSKTVESHTEKVSGSLLPKYSVRKITSFLCYGFCGFVTESCISQSSLDTIRHETKEILRGMLSSRVLTERP